MKEQLQLHELCAYLPYDVDIQRSPFNIKRLTLGNAQALLDGTMPGKLILRPLSDLTKEIEHNGESIMPIHRMCDIAVNFGVNKGVFERMLVNILEGSTLITELPYYLVQKLFEWHFDVFGLLDRGMAERKID